MHWNPDNNVVLGCYTHAQNDTDETHVQIASYLTIKNVQPYLIEELCELAKTELADIKRYPQERWWLIIGHSPQEGAIKLDGITTVPEDPDGTALYDWLRLH